MPMLLQELPADGKQEEKMPGGEFRVPFGKV